jgi:hypothetical protein
MIQNIEKIIPYSAKIYSHEVIDSDGNELWRIFLDGCIEYFKKYNECLNKNIINGEIEKIKFYDYIKDYKLSHVNFMTSINSMSSSKKNISTVIEEINCTFIKLVQIIKQNTNKIYTVNEKFNITKFCMLFESYNIISSIIGKKFKKLEACIQQTHTTKYNFIKNIAYDVFYSLIINDTSIGLSSSKKNENTNVVSKTYFINNLISHYEKYKETLTSIEISKIIGIINCYKGYYYGNKYLDYTTLISPTSIYINNIITKDVIDNYIQGFNSIFVKNYDYIISKKNDYKRKRELISCLVKMGYKIKHFGVDNIFEQYIKSFNERIIQHIDKLIKSKQICDKIHKFEQYISQIFYNHETKNNKINTYVINNLNRFNVITNKMVKETIKDRTDFSMKYKEIIDKKFYKSIYYVETNDTNHMKYTGIFDKLQNYSNDVYRYYYDSTVSTNINPYLSTVKYSIGKSKFNTSLIIAQLLEHVITEIKKTAKSEIMCSTIETLTGLTTHEISDLVDKINTKEKIFIKEYDMLKGELIYKINTNFTTINKSYII